MQVRIEDVSPVEKKLVVEVPWETVSTKLNEAYKDLGKGVALKGFRKGKVPRSVLERMFGKRVRQEVALELLRESFFTATAEHKLEAVAEPRVGDDELVIKKGEPFSFEAVVEVRGEVEAQNYDGLELKKRRLEVGDEAVDHTLEQLRREHTELLPIEEGRDTTARTDVLSLAVKGTIGDLEVDRPSIMVDLGDTEHEPLPGMVEKLLGLPLDVSDHTLEIEIPADYSDESIAGKTASLTISITDARKKEMPELDDEFAKDLGRGETLDELKASVRKDLEGQQEEEIKREVRDAALKELVKRNQIPVAPSLVERSVEYQFQRLKMMLGMQGDGTSGLSEDLRAKMRPQAADEVRGQLLLEAIADKEGIEVGEEELDTYFNDLGKARNTPGARLRAEYDRDGRLDNVKFSLRQDKTLDLLVSRATVTEVDAAELRAEMEAAQAAAEAASESGAEGEGGAPEQPTEGASE